MYSWLVTVLLLASAAYCSGGQGAVGVGWDGVHWGWKVGGGRGVGEEVLNDMCTETLVHAYQDM